MKTQKPSGDLMQVPDAATYLSVSPKTIWSWVYERRLPSYRLGRSVRLKQSDLDAFLQRGHTPAVAEGVQ